MALLGSCQAGGYLQATVVIQFLKDILCKFYKQQLVCRNKVVFEGNFEKSLFKFWDILSLKFFFGYHIMCIHESFKWGTHNKDNLNKAWIIKMNIKKIEKTRLANTSMISEDQNTSRSLINIKHYLFGKENKQKMAF